MLSNGLHSMLRANSAGLCSCVRSKGRGTGLEVLGKEITLKLRCETDMDKAMGLGIWKEKSGRRSKARAGDHRFILQAT